LTRLRPGHDDASDAAVERFLATGDPPIVFTLGSAAVGHAGDFYEHSLEAVEQLGARAILLIGRDGANLPKRPLPASVLAVAYAPHAGVLPRASVTVPWRISS